MPNLIFQPASGRPAPENAKKSLAKPVELSTLTLSGAERMALQMAAGGTGVYAWGCTHDRAWKQMHPGDNALFMTQPGVIEYKGVIIATIRSPQLAIEIWGAESAAYEYVYFLTGVVACNFSRNGINAARQNSSAPTPDSWQQVRYIDNPAAVQRVLALVGSQNLPPGAQVEASERLQIDIEDAVDGLRLASYRKEHAKLKKALFANRLAAQCAVCGQQFPKQFLIAAHLKKRSICTPSERINSSIVVPMCAFGCDALYERGFLSFSAASDLVIPTALTVTLAGTEVQQRLQALIGRKSPYVMSARGTFVSWHNETYGAVTGT